MTKVGTGRFVHLCTNVAAPSSTTVHPRHKGVDVRTTLLAPYDTSCRGLYHIHLLIFLTGNIGQGTDNTSKGDLALLDHVATLWNVCTGQFEEPWWALDSGVNAFHGLMLLLLLH